ncbi:MAG: DUF1036 domain-containing protein [Rhizobiales bacterium]|nr:DUF1036 domain-containing protein [Hyphomicrobiales bacterium]
MKTALPFRLTLTLLALFALTTGFLLLGTGNARADYYLCNKSSYVLDSAIAYRDNNTWRSKGWLRLMPGSCQAALVGEIDGETYYVFAHSIDAHQGRVKYFSGNQSFCTVSRNFSIEGRDSCARRGYDADEFMAVQTTPGENWTTSFSESTDFDEDESRIAVTQRLLRDNGLLLPRIDGIAAKNTVRAIEAYQRNKGLKATGKITDELIDHLLANATKAQAKLGLDLCNKTKHLVWAAVASHQTTLDMSSGWIRVEPGTCRKAIKGKLTAAAYYLYAEGVDEAGIVTREGEHNLLWSGDTVFCTKPTRFEIRDRTQCLARGYDERRFMRIETGGRAQSTMNLK